MRNKIANAALNAAPVVLFVVVLCAIIGGGLHAVGLWPTGPHASFATQGCS